MNKLQQIRQTLTEVVEEAVSKPIDTKPQKSYPIDDPMISRSRDLVSMTLLRMIVRDPKKTEAYRLGLVDDFGHTIKVPKTSEEKEALNSLQRLAFTLRNTIGSTRANSLKSLIPSTSVKPEEVLPKILVLGNGIDRGAVESYLSRLYGDETQKG